MYINKEMQYFLINIQDNVNYNAKYQTMYDDWGQILHFFGNIYA